MTTSYEEELTAATQSIGRLKRRYARRRAQMAQIKGLMPPSMPQVQAERIRTPSKTRADPDLTIKHLLACCLLAPGTSIPVDTLGLHAKAPPSLLTCRQTSVRFVKASLDSITRDPSSLSDWTVWIQSYTGWPLLTPRTSK